MFDGRLWIVTHRQKTNTMVMVPLLPPALKILNKYEGCYNDGQLMPIITNQKLNCYLKEIADICGIEKNLTFHIARYCILSFSLKISTLQKIGLLIGNDLETSGFLYSVLFCN